VESRLIPLLVDPDPNAMRALLREDVAFHSPFADYQGRAEVARLFAIIPTVLTELRVDRSLERPGEIGTFLACVVSDRPAQAFVSERYEDGALAEITLMLRPYEALKLALRLMAEALAR
jgi:hypothetical protein